RLNSKRLQFRSLPGSWPGRREHVDGKRCQPMLAGVITTRHVRQGILSMRPRRLCQDVSRSIISRQRVDYIAHAPGPSQVQAIEMDQFRIAAIGNNRGSEQSLGLAAIE